MQRRATSMLSFPKCAQGGRAEIFDNRQVYGYLTLTEEPAHAEMLLGPEIDAQLAPVFEDLRGADRPICLPWG